MDIASLSVKRPVLATVMSIIIILFGVIGYSFLGVREFPSIDPPVITVRTSYAGANADIIQSQITEPLEKAINGIEGIRNISSSSNQGSSIITVEFNLSSNLEAAANDVRDKVSQAVRQLPQDIDAPPVVTKADANSDAIISMTLVSNTRSLLEVSDYAENVVAQNMQTIPGVSTVQIWGQRRYSMRLRLDPKKLAAYKLTPLDIKQALDRENVDLPSGKIAGNSTELTVNTVGRISTIPEFEMMIVKEDNENIVHLKDVAKVELGAENEETILKESGIPMIGIAVVPQPGANYIDISDEFYRRFELIKKELPKDYTVDIALDTTRFIKKSITEVKETLVIAIVLVILIIYLFFRDWLMAFRPLLDIPVSLIGAFFIMYIMGYSINVLTLLAIVLATGLVVDDGIVVTENIFKKLEKGLKPNDAAIEGTREIYTAVISTSLTLAAVFMPILFLEGFVGRLFREFGVVIAGSVLISAFVSLTLTPMLNAKLIRKNHAKRSRFYKMTEPFFTALDSNFKNSVTRFLQKRWWALVILVISAVVVIFVGGQLKSELSPLEDRDWLRLAASAPEGTSYEKMDALMDKVSKFIDDSVPEKTVCLTVTAPGFAGSGAVNSGFGRVALLEADQRVRSQDEIAGYLSKYLSKFPEGKVFVIQQQSISSGSGPRGSLPVQFVLQTNDFKKLRDKLPQFMDRVNKDSVFQGSDVNLKFNKPELIIEIQREKAKTLGLSVADIAQTLQLALSGQRFSYYIMGDKQYQVIGQVDRKDRDDPSDIGALYVRNNKGEMIQMANVISIEERSSPPQLYHYDRYQSATISAGLAPGKTIGDGVKEMKRIAKELLDESFTTSTTGSSRDFEESSSNVLFAFILALVLIYLLLAAQFESFIEPFIIMLTVPTALAGAIFALWYFNQTLNIFSEIGMVMLIGLVTKNGILIIEFTNQLRKKGRTVRKAVIAASTARLRPILMTSLATMLGAMPIALALGAGSESRMGMGIVIIGGLLVSMILTLFVIPAVYMFFEIMRIKRKRKNQLKANMGIVVTLAGLLLCVHNTGVAQNELGLDEALKGALEKNYEVLMARNNSDISAKQNNYGNAGMAPQVSLNGGYSKSNLNSHQEFSSGVIQEKTGANASNFNASVNVSWVLFDGLKMFAIKKRLDLTQDLSTLQLKQQMEQTAASVITNYFEVVRLQNLINAAKQNLSIYEERKKIAQLKLDVGSDSKVDYLLTQSDENKAKSELMQMELQLLTAKANLNNLMVRPVDVDFRAKDSITISYKPGIEELKKSGSNNTGFLISKKNEDITQQTIKEARSANLPLVQLNGAYNLTSSQSQAGFVFLSRQNGLNAGLTASWLLFNGMKNKKLIEERQLRLLGQKYNSEWTQQLVDGLVFLNYQIYMTNQQIMEMEKQNLADAQELLGVSMERYKIGKANLLETMQTQKNLEDAQTRYINALYNTKKAETELLKANGQLVR